MKNSKKIYLELGMVLSLLIPISLFADDKDHSLGNLSLEELLAVKVESGSQEKKEIRATPTIATIITNDEIKHSGARDLIDVLNLIPGIAFGIDTQGVVGIAVRGMWGHEGKVLLLVDGEEMNEASYSTTQWGNRFPLDSIDRIEVIRGPGSAANGGYAELAIVNIISNTADTYEGAMAQSYVGRTASGISERTLSLGIARHSDAWKWSTQLYLGKENVGQRSYTDNTGASIPLNKNASQSPAFVNIGASNDKWNFRFLFENYHTTDRTAYGTNVSMPMNTDFHTLAFGVKYNEQLADDFSLTPEFHFKQQSPWNVTQNEAKQITQLYYDVMDQEATARLTAHKKITDSLNTHLGIEGKVVKSFDSVSGGSTGALFPNGQQAIQYDSHAIFAETNLSTKIADFTLGGRYESHSAVGGSVVPRFAMVKQIDDFHLKGLYSWGFREPGVENLRFNPTLKPEITKATEVELGYKFTPTTFSTINFYNITLVRPIIYNYSGGMQSYQNSSRAVNNGFEWNLRQNWSESYLNTSYSYFNPLKTPADYQVSGQQATNLGFAKHKTTFVFSSAIINSHMRFNFSEILFSTRYGFDWDPAAAGGVSIHKFPVAHLTNLFLEYSDIFSKGLDLSFGVFNLLDENFRLIQPYDGGHPPISTQARDWVARISYKVGL